MTTLESQPAALSRDALRRTIPVIAGSVTVLASAVGLFGSIFFTSLEGWTNLGVTFVFSYAFLSLFGIVSAVAMLGHVELGRIGVISYALWLVAFSVLKIVAWGELEALAFYLAGLLIGGFALLPASRDYTSR